MKLRSGTRVLSMILLGVWPLFLPLAAAQEPLYWNFYGTRCELPDTTAVRLSCGRMGVFYFSRGDFPAPGSLTRSRTTARSIWRPKLASNEPECPINATDQGFQEALPFYSARPGGHAPKQPVAVLTGLAFRKGKWRAAAGEQNEYPCAQGECFTPLDEVGPADDWVAQIDMNPEHYSSVGQTIANVMPGDVGLVLFDLESDLRPELEMEGVTDFHVLQQVCQVLEAFESDEADRQPPLALNMSFGRYDEDAALADPTACATDKVGCWVAKALRHLHRPDPGPHQTELVAAAGNHRELLFPAAYQDVISVGALDQKAYTPSSRDAVPNWETPQSAQEFDGLFPGQGICFEMADSEWLAPAGSSYSAALLSGLLSSARRFQGEFDAHPPDPWIPSRICTETQLCGWHLSAGEVSGPRVPRKADAFLDQILIDEGSACSTKQSLTSINVAALPLIPTEQFVLPLSYPLMAHDFHRPLPEPSMCIPCDEGGGGPAAMMRSNRAGFIREGPVLIDLSGGARQNEGVRLTELYLRVDSGFIPLDLTPENLQDLSAGLIEAIRIDGNGVGMFFSASQKQISLMAIMEEVETLLTFWSTTPVRVRQR